MTSISNTLVSNLSFYSLISITNRRKILLIFYQHTSLITSLDLERRYNIWAGNKYCTCSQKSAWSILLTWDDLACEEAHWCEFGENLGLRTSRHSPGGYFRNFWVGMCRWNPGTLNLYQSKFSWILLPYTRLNSPNPPIQLISFPKNDTLF